MTELDTFIEWRARRIQDPVERLKYLRQNVSSDPWVAEAAGSSRWSPRSRLAMILVVLAALLAVPAYTISSRKPAPAPAFIPRVEFVAPATVAEQIPNVWIVDKKGDVETFSNGLRIENQYAVSNQPRGSFPVFPRPDIDPKKPEWQDQPVGIVYHTTESHLVPFEPEQTRVLKSIGQGVLAYVQRNRSYHFVIDRFGRVYRVVRESDAANHAGNSIWADEKNVYLNLNTSFFGVAIETQTDTGQNNPSANAAQILSARILTQMLRSKYKIPAGNCVTHAQVSVNPSNRLIGYHTDWAGGFPFLEIGLKDNYMTPPASMYAYGFGYDPTYIQSTGARLWQGLLLAEDQVRRDAGRRGISVPQYREILQKRYRDAAATVKGNAAGKEKSDET